MRVGYVLFVCLLLWIFLHCCLQILKVDGHGLACDLWSIGVMAYALVSGEFPWYSESRDVCGQMIKYTPLRFPEEVGGRANESQHQLFWTVK